MEMSVGIVWNLELITGFERGNHRRGEFFCAQVSNVYEASADPNQDFSHK
jgi:hypothetical protein